MVKTKRMFKGEIFLDDKKLEQLLLKVQKPGRYSGGEAGSVYKTRDLIRFAMCFPDTYEIGMSHLGMKILYSLLNSRDDVWCERCFAPWVDFEQVMKENNIPLFALESRDPLSEFDIIGFSVMYEMCYSNILNMLDLGGVPVLSADRGDEHPLVVAGGPCVCNPEPIADFIDLFMIGEGEEVISELVDLYKKYKPNWNKKKFLIDAAKIEGIYVPSLYNIEYNSDGTINSISAGSGAPDRVKRRIVKDLNKSFYPKEFVVPYTEIVHDRAVEEIFRGCIRGCRFCQAGFIYRPVREKDAEVACTQAKDLCDSTGYDELSLLSLSTSDYTELSDLLNKLLDYGEKNMLGLSLPSLRIDNFSDELLQRIQSVRKSGLTFAPEAGTQRLRDAINKNITEDDILSTCKTAFLGGYTNVKLYFMLGLPTETDDDVVGIARLADKIVSLFYSLDDRPRGKSPSISISVSCFVPKPFTPFQFAPQDTMEELRRKQQLLVSSVSSRKVKVSWHDSETSFLEAVFAKGDRRLGAVIYQAFKRGARLCGWGECFDMQRWLDAFESCGIDPAFYANRRLPYDETLPWEIIDIGVDKQFFIKEFEKASCGDTTPDCRNKCSGCGAASYGCGVCFEKRQQQSI